jgi:hypothetical protein
LALQEQSKDDVLQQMQQRMEQLEKELAELKGAETKPSRDLESQLDESIHQSPVDPLLEPTRLNFSAPGLDRVNWSGTFRWRAAYWNNFRSQAGSDDITSFDQRLDLGMGLRLTEKTTLNLELHDARVWGTEIPGSTTQDNDEFTSVNLEVSDFYGTGYDLVMGRQKIYMGAGRQIAEDAWLNDTTRFDGFLASGPFGDNSSMTFAAVRLADADYFSVTEISPGAAASPGGGAATSADAFMAYYTNQTDELGTIDAYVFYVDSDVGSTLGENNLVTYGARWAHSVEPFWWDVEAATQFGKILGTNVGNYGFDHWAFASRAGWDADLIECLTGIYVGYDYATGGSNTYVQLAPDLHGWFGIMDFASWGNIRQYVVGAEFTAGEGNLDISWRWLGLDDGTFNAGGGADPWESGSLFGGYNAAGSTGGSDELGQELDIVYTVACSENSDVDAGVGYFFPKNGWSNAMSSKKDVLFGYLAYGISF